MEKPDEQIPDENLIGELLSRFRPIPSERFYQRMGSAPWISGAPSGTRVSGIEQGEKASLPTIVRGRWQLPAARNRVLRPLAVSLGVLLLIFAGIMVFPSVRVQASMMLRYFLRLANDQPSVMVTVPAPGDPASFGTPEYFALTLDQVEAQASFPIQVFGELPAGMAFTGAHFNPAWQQASLRYKAGDQTLILTQRKLGIVEQVQTVGVDTPVETVQVDDRIGEYVSGGWVVAPGSERVLQTATPGTQVSLGIVWDPALPQQILRWQEDGVSYEILVSGESISRAALLDMAASLK